MEDSRDAGEGEAELSNGDRLRRFVGYMFARHDPGAQMPPVPEELSEWARDTMLAAFAGLMLMGGRQWMQERRAGPVVAPPDSPTKAHAARAVAEEQTQRLAHIADASTRGGLRVGGIAAIFYGGQLLCGVYRGRYDFLNTAYGGMAAGAVLGLSRRGGGPAGRLRSSVLGAALGAAVGVPAGVLQDRVAGLLPPEQQERRRRRAQQTEAIIAGTVEADLPRLPPTYDPAAAVVELLERSLATSPTRAGAAEHQGGAHPDPEPKPEPRPAGWRFWARGQ